MVKQELNKIDLIEADAARAWERSIGKKTKTKKEAGRNGQSNKIIEITENHAGDP